MSIIKDNFNGFLVFKTPENIEHVKQQKASATD
jgi:hypothetical protein